VGPAESHLPGSLVRKEGQPETGDAATNEAYDGLGHTYKFYMDVLNRDSLDGHGMPLNAAVHFGEDYLNAFWDGSQMVFGDGDGQIFLRFTKSLDVIAHELTHAVTENTAGLIYHNQPGALNESFSDVFGSLVKQYLRKETTAAADWLIGRDIIGPNFNGTALRSMKNPGSAYSGDRQPKDMAGYVQLPDTYPGDWGGVHTNSGIPNRAFYLVADALGGYAWERAGRIWYQTLLALNPQSNFADCAATSIAIAGRDYGVNSKEHSAVEAAWQKVGVTQETQAQKLAKRPARKHDGKLQIKDVEKLEPSLQHLASALNEVLAAIGAH
jgi:Zn-dependent metalloprotease